MSVNQPLLVAQDVESLVNHARFFLDPKSRFRYQVTHERRVGKLGGLYVDTNVACLHVGNKAELLSEMLCRIKSLS